jgi:hypothetical protein
MSRAKPLPWSQVPRAAWEMVVAHVPLPWPREVAIADLRWWLNADHEMVDGHHVGTGKLPGRRQLEKRWGWTEWHVRDLLRDEEEWRPEPRHTPATPQPLPRETPATPQRDTAQRHTSRESTPATPREPQRETPPASTRAFDLDRRQQTSDPDQSQSARAGRAEVVASVLSGWLALRGISAKERATWEAGGEAFLRQLRKAVDSERSVGALGLPDLRAGIALALARHDARAPEREPEPDEPATEPEAWPEAVAGDVDEPHAGDELEADAPSDDAADATDRLWSTLQASQVAPAWARSWSRPDVARRLRPAWKGAAIEVEPPSSPAGMRYLAMVADAYGLKLVWRNAA